MLRRRHRWGKVVGSRNAHTLTHDMGDGMTDGMAIMTHRTTFSLDEVTAQRIRKLSALWQVSQAEVIRRVVARTEAGVAPDPIAMLNELHQAGDGLAAAKARSYLAEVRKDRQQWRVK